MTELIKKLNDLIKNSGYSPRERLNVVLGPVSLPILHAELNYLEKTLLSQGDAITKISSSLADAFYLSPVTALFGLGIGLASAGYLMIKRKNGQLKMTGTKQNSWEEER